MDQLGMVLYRYSIKSITLDFLNVKFQFGGLQKCRYSQKSGSSENLCSY